MKIGVIVQGAGSDRRRAILQSRECDTIVEVQDGVAATQVARLAALEMGPGDCVAVWRLADLFSSIRETVLLVDTLDRAGCNLEVVKEGINTQSEPMVRQFCSMLASAERLFHRTKVKSGVVEAIQAGGQHGRRRKLSAEDLNTIISSVKRGDISVSEAAKKFGVSRSTLQRNLSELRRNRLFTAR